ncbi:hypothetical protein [Hyalangium versicolor]|uniref:hypothetical protein n=1 Tax=Hyalangium versicolor TaxID=2861190 RepID=UPI001CC9E2F5|nr:hypothetical protein [Hyalangium versicolor]
MNRMALAVLTSLLSLLPSAACTPTAKAAPDSSSKADTAKVSAPVTVDAQLQEGQARVTVRFDSPASDVKINVHGVDGLVVKSAATPVAGSSFTQASTSTFDVAFTPGPGRSHLVVGIEGSFNGTQRSTVKSFAVGTPSAEQQKSQGNVITGDDGQRIKILPSNGGANAQ